MSERQRPGFFSPLGILLAVLIVAGVVAVTLVAGPLLFSPGPLNAQAKAAPLGGVASHASLGAHCGACHPAPWATQTAADRCLACHGDVATELSSHKGLHATLVKSPTCDGCHPEHHGATAALTSLNGATFPHDQFGFSLRTHRETSCADCHPQGYGSGTFDVGVCATCHEKLDASFMTQHEAQFGKDCLPCHNGSGSSKVDHSKFAFKLTGKHAGLACNACHAGDKSAQDFKNTPQDCNSCHAKDDVHKGSNGKDCGSCHSTDGWQGANFNHTVFPVDHGTNGQQSNCKTCHPASTSQYTCFGCHAHTQSNVVGQHEGQSLAQLTDCIRCHAGGKGGGD